MGIGRYARLRGTVSLTTLTIRASLNDWLAGGQHEGIVAFVDREGLESYRGCGLPVVNLAQDLKDGQMRGLPTVGVDYGRIGRLAAEYFLRRGFRSLAMCSYYYDGDFGRLRRALLATGRSWGAKVASYDRLVMYPAVKLPRGVRHNWRPTLLNWIMRLPRPVGILCSDDFRAVTVLRICQAMQVKVP